MQIASLHSWALPICIRQIAHALWLTVRHNSGIDGPACPRTVNGSGTYCV